VRMCGLVIPAFAFFQLLLNLTFLVIRCCRQANLRAAPAKTFSAGMNVPSDRAPNLLMPRSTPTIDVARGFGSATSRSVWTLTNHLSPRRETVTFFGVSAAARLFRYLIQPSLGRKIRPLTWSNLNCLGSG
jgi:hypothetical protein